MSLLHYSKIDLNRFVHFNEAPVPSSGALMFLQLWNKYVRVKHYGQKEGQLLLSLKFLVHFLLAYTFGLKCEIVPSCNFRGSELRSVSRSGPYPQLSNFLIIFLSCWLDACVCVHVCLCVPQCLPVKQRACPLEVLLFSPVLLPPAVCLPPPAGQLRLPHADLFNCLPVPGPTGECVCVFPLRWEGQGRRYTHTHARTRRYTQGVRALKHEQNHTLSLLDTVRLTL